MSGGWEIEGWCMRKRWVVDRVKVDEWWMSGVWETVESFMKSGWRLDEKW